ncbi:unnamed protein product [Bemisia tabaci]|uniref:Uncharacterized protein n=1 Tax=Bemisia tabaci TaxID=7038 RepID=A0A9P0CBR3_BEMTA|nr:unnamed protein product [Bemisia tabaci]
MEAIRCLAKCIKSYRCLKCLKVSSVETLGPSVGSRRFHISNKLLLSISPQEKQIPNNTHAGKLMLCISLGFLDIFKSKELDPESELIMTLKRSILLIQREEFPAAEQMLHVALRQAQEQGNSDGITYAYDLMANLAMTRGQFEKAEKLFVLIMNRLISNQVPENDLRNLHISLKLAKILEEKGDRNKAELGYKFCLDHLEEKVAAIRDLKLKKTHFSDQEKIDNENTIALYGMSLDWFAKFLLQERKYEESVKCYKKAYKLCVEVNGDIHEQNVILLNDIGTVNYLRGNYDKALKYLTRAIEMGKHLPQMEDLSSVYINLGKVYLEQGLKAEAEKHCRDGWKNANRLNNEEGIKDAEMCLSRVQKAMA